MSDVPQVQIDCRLFRPLLEEAFTATGISGEEARLIADSLIEAEVCEVPTHGMLRVPSYIRGLRSGRFNARADVRPVHQTDAATLFDGDNALGYLPALRACEAAVESAKRLGIGVAGTRNTNEFGRAAYYTEWIAAHGFFGIVAANTLPLLAGPGGAVATHGNNPLSYTLPGPDGPIFDAAWTPRSGGELVRRRMLGLTLPLEWGYTDKAGRPTTDPAAAAQSVAPAIGGAKGFGISLLVDMLAGVLTRAGFGPNIGPDNRGVGAFVLVIDPDIFGAGALVPGSLEATADAVRASGSRLPGDRARAARAAHADGHIGVASKIFDEMTKAISEGDPGIGQRMQQAASPARPATG